MKTEVYSWRVSTDLKTELEREARRRKISLSAALDSAAQEWLKKRNADAGDVAVQRELHEAASKFFGTLASGNHRRAETARQTIRERLLRKHAG